MQKNGVMIEDTFAEAFGMRGCRLTVTAPSDHWALVAARAITGFATSVIGCGIEADVEGRSPAAPDGRPGYDCLFFANSWDGLANALLNRVGQALMTSVGSACFCGALPEIAADSEDISRFDIGGKLRFFGDGYQCSKVIGNTRYWRVPVMDGEFLVEETFLMLRAVGGGNFLLLGPSHAATLAAAEAAVAAIRQMRGVALPFPGGMVRSGSQVGSRYKFLKASTNISYCPTIRSRAPDSELLEGDNAVLEIVIDGLTEALVARAMRVGIEAACACGGIRKITAGNYGGKLGKFHFHLHRLLGDAR
ncbi:MAG: formylmethanofuran--tetrahydromethanopterin N-formyltransferase [Synergistaceae bacterium]|jgi:formylmethanofuran--tetrahydromethanopterin N-formyltransferase|nr:formylmethanofuran--tetrahydromethanopterin N-formyltransferase [Synergistaceae bacterium]